MGIQMIGIDHSMAEIDIRTIFSFTKKKAAEALEQIKQKKGVLGCVLLSTCNRMELWVSTEDAWDASLYEILCEVRELPEPTSKYEPYFIKRSERDAAAHLFRLACGLESRILGEDQIITQVKDALSMARAHYAADNVLEILFRMAVTAAKKVKTNVVLSGGNHSVIHQALATLQAEGFQASGKTCMVIGNGEMGKLAATVLQKAGADVTVTVRQYRSGIVDIPQGCKRIDYGNRMSLIGACDLVVSATASPNYTITAEGMRAAHLRKTPLLLDLAVPRDIDPEIQKQTGIKLYDIDYFKVDAIGEQMRENICKAENILEEQMEEFYVWYECRDLIPRIQKLKEDMAQDLELRLHRILHDLPMEADSREKLEGQITHAAQKTANKLLFELRDHISRETFRACVDGMEKIYSSRFE